MAKKVKDPNKVSRVSQIRQSYQITNKSDPRIGLILLGTFVVAAAAGFGLLYLAFPDTLVFPSVFAVLVGLLAVLIVFGRRAQTAALASIEGQPGAAAAALGMLRRGWKTDPGIGFTKQQDIIHRLVGPPGIILIGEGSQTRLKPLMAAERRKHERVAAETPIHEVYVGNGEGEVPLRKIVRYVTKLGRNLKPAQMTDILARIKAIDANRSSVPLPKGPVPTSMKGARGNQRGR